MAGNVVSNVKKYYGGQVPVPGQGDSDGKVKVLVEKTTTMEIEGAQTDVDLLYDSDDLTVPVTPQKLGQWTDENYLIAFKKREDDGHVRGFILYALETDSTSADTLVNRAEFIAFKENMAGDPGASAYEFTMVEDSSTLARYLQDENGEVTVKFNLSSVNHGEQSGYLSDLIGTDSPYMDFEIVRDEDGAYLNLNADGLADEFEGINERLDVIEGILDELPSDEHGYFNSSLVTTPGDGTTESLVIDNFRISEGRSVHGDNIEFVTTHQEGGVDFGEVYLNPGTYILNVHYTLQWIGNPRGTFLPLVANVGEQPFDFSYEHEDILRSTRIVTKTTRSKFGLNFPFDADTPPMGIWVKYLEIAQITYYNHSAVTHDSTLAGSGQIGDPLKVTPAAFGNVKDIPTSISQFRNGDVIPVDGPIGPAKMPKNDLLRETAQNTLAGNVAPAFDPTRTSDNPYKKGEKVVYFGVLYVAVKDHYGAWLGSDFKAVSIADYSGNTDLKPISYETGKYATVTGSPSHIELVSDVNAVTFKYDVSQFNFDLYETTRRITSVIPICVFADADGLSLGYNLSTTVDVDNYKVVLPEGTKYVYVNCNVGYYSRLYLSQSDFNEYAYKILSTSDAKKITITPETNGGWAAYDNSYFRKIFDSWSDSMKFAVVKTADLFGAKKIYVSTDPNSSLGRVAFFYDSCGKVLGSVDSRSEVSDLEIVIPEGTETIYINCRISKSVSYYYYKDIEVAVDSIYENVGKLNTLFAITSSEFANKFAIHRASVYSDSFKEFSIRKFGWDSVNLKFIVELQSGNVVIPMERRFTTTPTSRQILSFIGSSASFVYAEFEIDFDALPLQYFESSSDEIIVAVSPCNNLKYVTGVIDYTFNGRCIISEGMRLYGQKCTINIYDPNGCFLLYSNACLSGIIFNDKSASPLVRETYSAAEIEEKPTRDWLFKPVLSLQDLSDEDTDFLIGENVDYVVYIFENAVNAEVSSCTFNNFNRCVVYDVGSRHTDARHSIVSDNMFNMCRVGVYVGGEFTRHTKNFYMGCLIGLWIRANNYNAVNCNFVRCDCGMYFDSTQDAHGEVSTFEFAHDGLAGVYAKRISNNVGFMFTNCQFAQANIIAEVAYALKLTGCRVDTFIQILAGAKNSVIGCNMRDFIARDEGHSSVYDVPADTLLALNRSMSSTGNDDDFNNL